MSAACFSSTRSTIRCANSLLSRRNSFLIKTDSTNILLVQCSTNGFDAQEDSQKKSASRLVAPISLDSVCSDAIRGSNHCVSISIQVAAIPIGFWRLVCQKCCLAYNPFMKTFVLIWKIGANRVHYHELFSSIIRPVQR